MIQKIVTEEDINYILMYLQFQNYCYSKHRLN